jgi:hypothetical protein
VGGIDLIRLYEEADERCIRLSVEKGSGEGIGGSHG